MAETMEQYMSKTRADYGSGISWHKIDAKDNFKLKGDFLKKLRDNTFSGSDHEDTNGHIEKVLKIVDLFHIPNITQDQVMLRAFPMSLTRSASRWLRNKPSSLITTWEDLKTKQILDSKGAIPSKTVADAKVAIQEMVEYSQKWRNGTSRKISTEASDGLASIQAQLNNLGREIKKVNEKVYDAQVGCKQCKGPHYTKDFPLKEEVKTLEEAYYTQFGRPYQGGGYRAAAPGFYQRNNANPSYQERRQSMEETLSKFMSESAKRHEENSNMIKEIRASTNAAVQNQGASIKTLEIQIEQISKELATVKYPKEIVENVLVGIGKFVFPVDFIILDMPEDVKVPLILERPFLSTAYIKIDVFKRKITLRVGDEKIIFKSVKPASSLIKRVYMLSLRERMELNLEARLMRETLVLNRSLDPLYGDYIELNNLNVLLELRRDQVDDLMPTIKEGDVIEEFRARNDARMVSKIFEYPSDYDHDKKIRVSCPYNLKFSCMVGFEFLHANFFPILYVNVMSKKFHNSIMKDKLEYKGNNVVESLMNIPIFVGTFSVLTYFAVLEDMDAYRDQDMGHIILREPFCKASCVEAKRFDGLIIIHNGSDNVTYQMARSHPRFKHLSNAQCNKIKPLLKVILHDKLNGISHPYQKLKSFYKGVLNLGPEYVRDAKME
ncbi:putative reverse transcriptase domain-containing protein [Tanacetum coccineum]